MSITVAIPTIPPRRKKLDRALDSVYRQTIPAHGISIAVDHYHAGVAVNRQRALSGVWTDWVAFLDDDDYFYPHHLETLWDLAHGHQADVAYSWFDGNNPFPMHRGRQFDPDDPHHLTVTMLVRTELAKQVGFVDEHPVGWTLPQEDWRFILGLRDAGAKFIGTGEITWHYTIDGENTSGLSSRW